MPFSVTFTALLGLFAAGFTIAAPTERAACPTTLPSAFKIKEDYGFFEVSSGTVINAAKKSSASYFYVNDTVYEGPTVPLLSYSAPTGVDYGLFITDSTNGTIVLVPSTVTPPNYYLPVDVSLESNCVLSFTISEAHADFYLQDCAGKIVFATSIESGCNEITTTTLATS